MNANAQQPQVGEIIVVTSVSRYYPLLPKWETTTDTGAVLWRDRGQSGQVKLWLDTGRVVEIGHYPHVDGWRYATDAEAATHRAHLSAVHERALGPVPPSTLWLLDQDVEWWTAAKRRLLVEDMTSGHRANLIALLHRKAAGLYASFAFSPIFDGAPDDVIDDLDRTDPHEWLDEQPLVVRLRALNAAEVSS